MRNYCTRVFMHISELRIRNFRNFLTANFLFKKGVNTLVGENGSGKTNALYALRLLLDESLSRNAISLKESDFCRALGDWRGHWIILSLIFEDLDPSEGCQILKQGMGHMDNSGKGTFTFFFRPKLEIRKALYALSHEDTDTKTTDVYLKTLTIDQYEPVLTGRSTANFLDEEVYRAIVGDISLL